MNKKVRLERLTMLRDMLLNHSKLFKTEKVKFNICVWKQDREYTANGCGTAACALGSAAIHAPFVKRGLHMGRHKEWRFLDQVPVFKDQAGYKAGSLFFGINWDESYYLFSPNHYSNPDETQRYGFTKKQLAIGKGTANPTAKSVAKRVQVLIDHYTNSNQPLLSIAA